MIPRRYKARWKLAITSTWVTVRTAYQERMLRREVLQLSICFGDNLCAKTILLSGKTPDIHMHKPFLPIAKKSESTAFQLTNR